MAVSLTADVRQTAKASAAGRLLGTGPADSSPYPWRELTQLEVFTQTSGQRNEYSLADGTTTLAVDKPKIRILTSTATASFDFTLADGLYDQQRVVIEVSTSAVFGTNSVEVKNTSGGPVTSLARGLSYEMIWSASGDTWNRGIVAPRDLPLVFRSGSPTGVLTPGFANQRCIDTTTTPRTEYIAQGESNTSWLAIGTGVGAGDAAPTVEEFLVSGNLTSAQRAANNVQVHAGAASIDFNVPINTVGSWIIRAYDKDDDTPRAGCTVSVVGDAGEVNDTPAGASAIREIMPGGTAIVTSTGGPTPSVKVTGNLFESDTTRGTTTFASGDTLVLAADHQRSITITGNQTINVPVANIKAGFTAVYWAAGGDRSIIGLEPATHIIPSGGAATVHKHAAGALVCVGAKTTSPGVTILDLA